MLAAVLGGCIAATLLIGYFRPLGMTTSPGSFLSHWVKYSFLFVIAVPASLLGGGAISREFQDRTGYSTVGNPMGRSSIWLGKVLAALAGCLLTLCVVEATAAANLAYYFGFATIGFLFWESFVFIGVGVAGALGLAFFFGSLFKSGSISVLLSVFVLLVGFDLIATLWVNVNVEPWAMFDYGEQIILNVFKTPFPAHLVPRDFSVSYAPGTRAVIGRVMYNATIPEGLAIMAAYSVVGLIASLLVFQRREFTN
jgi:ABC-type transport system involved in multi-copper enzyme maturation permease subunit